MTEYYINKRTKGVSTDDRYYGQPGWLACTEEEYNEALQNAELAALRADNAKLREALKSLVGMIVIAQSNADQQTACLWMSIGNKQGVNEKVETALRVLEETSHAR